MIKSSSCTAKGGSSSCSSKDNQAAQQEDHQAAQGEEDHQAAAGVQSSRNHWLVPSKETIRFLERTLYINRYSWESIFVASNSLLMTEYLVILDPTFLIWKSRIRSFNSTFLLFHIIVKRNPNYAISCLTKYHNLRKYFNSFVVWIALNMQYFRSYIRSL